MSDRFEPWEKSLQKIIPEWPCPRCGLQLKTVGSPWDWEAVCDDCGPIDEGEFSS